MHDQKMGIDPTNLFVTNFSWNLTEEDMRRIFGEVGAVVSAKLITDRETGRSRGFWFVQFENAEDAARAIEELNGKEYDGREIAVVVAKPREERPSRGPRHDYA